MNFKLFKLHIKIKFYSLIGKINLNIPNIKVLNGRNEIKKILILFPFSEPAFRVAAYTFRKVGNGTKLRLKYVFLVNDDFKHLCGNLKAEVKVLEEISQDPNRISRNISLLNQLKKENYDMIIDLNTDFNLDASRIVSHIPARFKVGFCSKFSDMFYNLQIDLSKSGIIENGYTRICSMLEKN